MKGPKKSIQPPENKAGKGQLKTNKTKSTKRSGQGNESISFLVKEKVWRYPGVAGWFFIRVNQADSAKIRFFGESRKVGWGYICIQAMVGKTVWSTTLFPTKEKDFLIAIKASVRKAESIGEGDLIEVEFTLEKSSEKVERPGKRGLT